MAEAVAMAKWVRQEDGAWVYADEQLADAWAEIVKEGSVFKWELTNGKDAFAKGTATQMKVAQDEAKQYYDALIHPPKKAHPDASWEPYEVTLPGEEPCVTEAKNAAAALGHILKRKPGFTYKGITIGPNGEYLGLMHRALTNDGTAKIKKLK